MLDTSPTVRSCSTFSGVQLSGLAALGLVSFGCALVMSSLSTAGFWPFSAKLLGVLLLNCASLQILTGMAIWRRQQPFPALLLIAFGLFWCSRLAFDILPHAGFGTPLSAPAICGDLLLWGIFALILSNADECPKGLRLALYGIGLSLILQAAGALFPVQPLLILAGVLGCGAAATLFTALLPRRRAA